MSLFDKYKLYLYDNLSDSEKAIIGTEIMTQIALNKENLKVPGPDDYLSSFDDLGFVKDIIPDVVIINPNKKVEGIDTSFLVNLVAAYSLNYYWLNIKKRYATGEEIEKSLMGKKKYLSNINLGFLDRAENEDKDLKDYLKLYSNLEINITGFNLKNDFSITPVDYFNNLEKFVSILEISEEELTEKERYASLEKASAGLCRQFVDRMMKLLSALYMSGFSGFPQEGILLKNDADGVCSPILRISNNKPLYKNANGDNGVDNDIRIEEAISNMCPTFSNIGIIEDDKELLPNVMYFLEKYKNETPFIIPSFHLALQSANSQYAKGVISIRKWASEKKGVNFETWKQDNNGNSNTLIKWADVESWYKWALKNIYINALMQYKVNDLKLTGKDKSELAIYSNIFAALINGLSNIIVVSERDNKKYSKIELKIASTELNFEKIKDILDKTFNIGGLNLVDIENIPSKVEGFTNIRVIYDKEEANKTQLFAGEVIDRFIESGNIPTWSNALIGKFKNGNLFWWDGFMNRGKETPSDRCYTIYAASRAGKGIMTSTLVASAVADSKQVFYVDGKPENGAALGRIAWEKGKECFVFDGQAKGKDPFSGDMEKYSFNTRSISEKLKYLPKLQDSVGDIFSSEDILLYLGVMRYLKSLMLCMEIIDARSNGDGAEKSLPKDIWQVWVFDEMTSMSDNERTVREKFATYLDSKGIKYTNGSAEKKAVATISLKDIKDPNIINPQSMSYDKGVDFIYNWCQWSDNLMKKAIKSAVISLGKADVNLIFIFQNADWIRKDKSLTTLAKFVDRLQSTKIVGRGGLAKGCGEYGEAATMKTNWYSLVNIPDAYNWGMSRGADIRSAEVEVFNPFNIWAVPRGNMSDEGLPESEKVKYLKGYLDKLLSYFGKDVSDVLESSYLYADNAVKALPSLSNNGAVKGVKDYIYNACDLLFIPEDVDYTKILKSAVEDDKSDGTDVDSDIEASVKQKGASFGTFTAGTEDTDNVDDAKVTPSGSVTPTGKMDNPISTPHSPSTGYSTDDTDDADDVSTPSNGSGMVDSHSNDPRLGSVFEKFDPEYIKIINGIESEIDDLKGIPQGGKNVEKNSISFTKLRNKILRNFEGSYKISKNKFIESVKKVVTEPTLLSVVLNIYENKFTEDFKRLYSEVDNLSFNAQGDGDTGGTGGNNGNGANGAGDVGDVGGKGGPPAKVKGKISPATFNGQTIASDIDTGDMEYNTRKIDSMGNVKASRELTNRVIRDIKDQFGGVNNIDEITVNAGGSLIINGYGYAPKFGEAFMNSLGLAIKSEVQQGRIGRVVNLGQVVAAIMGNIFTLAIECPKTAMSDVFQAELGVRNGDYGRLFKNHRNLQTIYLPDQELTRDNPNQQRSGTGLGAKLAGLFGFGRGNRDSDNYVPNTATTNNGNSFIDQMYACKPVRILANAFGWTAGCQLVYLAATMLGPWGLVFGAFAAAGAYKEAKNGSQNNRNNNGGYSTKSRSGGGGSSSSRSSGQKSKNKKSNDFDE